MAKLHHQNLVDGLVFAPEDAILSSYISPTRAAQRKCSLTACYSSARIVERVVGGLQSLDKTTDFVGFDFSKDPALVDFVYESRYSIEHSVAVLLAVR